MVEESTNIFPKNFPKIFRKISYKRSKGNSKSSSYKAPITKTCKKFCKNVYLPERERVEMEYVKRNNIKNYLGATKSVKNFFLKGCHDIYCQPKCKNTKNKWLKSFTKTRRDKLIQQGAISGCRNLIKEQPGVYKNI